MPRFNSQNIFEGDLYFTIYLKCTVTFPFIGGEFYLIFMGRIRTKFERIIGDARYNPDQRHTDTLWSRKIDDIRGHNKIRTWNFRWKKEFTKKKYDQQMMILEHLQCYCWTKHGKCGSLCYKTRKFNRAWTYIDIRFSL